MGKEACRENNWIPEFDEKRRSFEGWAARTWNWYYIGPINKMIPPEECGMPLTAEERKHYLEAMEKLKKEREANPGVPIGYDLVELEE